MHPHAPVPPPPPVPQADSLRLAVSSSSFEPGSLDMSSHINCLSPPRRRCPNSLKPLTPSPPRHPWACDSPRPKDRLLLPSLDSARSLAGDDALAPPKPSPSPPRTLVPGVPRGRRAISDVGRGPRPWLAHELSKSHAVEPAGIEEEVPWGRAVTDCEVVIGDLQEWPASEPDSGEWQAPMEIPVLDVAEGRVTMR